MKANQYIPGKELSLSFRKPESCSLTEIETNEDQTIEIKLFVDMSVGIGGDIWPAAQIFCNLLTNQQWINMFQALFTNKSIIELGSGNGLVSILIDKIYKPSLISVTDVDSHLNHIQLNLEKNATNCCQVKSLDWFKIDDDNSNDVEPADVLLALECIYYEELYLPLIKTLQKKCKAGGLIILGMTRDFGSCKFFELLQANNFRYEKLPQWILNKTQVESRDRFECNSGIFLVRKNI